MAVTSTKLDAIRGDTNTLRLPFPLDLAPVVARFSVRLSNRPTTVIEKNLGAGVTWDTQGFYVTLDPWDTEVLPRMLHVLPYELELTLQDGSVKTIFQGPLYVFTDIAP